MRTDSAPGDPAVLAVGSGNGRVRADEASPPRVVGGCGRRDNALWVTPSVASDDIDCAGHGHGRPMAAIRAVPISIGVDPLGGAGVHYWGPIAERSGLTLTVVNQAVDQTFRFVTVDWDGQIRMDPSSPYAMQRVIGLKDRFEIACDTDHDRHGIVTEEHRLLPPNHYLSVAIFCLFQHRPEWGAGAAVGRDGGEQPDD